MRTLGFLIGASVLGACVVDSDFNPRGSDVTASSQWSIVSVNALSYNTLEEACQRAAFDRVQIVFSDFGDTYVDEHFSFPCNYVEPGIQLTCFQQCYPATGGFDTSPERVLEYGIYQTRWRAVDAEGNVRAESQPLELVTRPPDDHLVLTPVEFVVFQPFGTDASLKASWTIRGASTNLASACQMAGVTEVGLEVRDSTAPKEDGELIDKAPCEAGQYISPQRNLAFGLYQFTYLFFNAAGGVLGTSSPTVVEVRNAGEYTLGVADYSPP